MNLCRTIEECNYFTYFSDNGACHGYANCQDFSTETCDDCVTGTRDCEGKKERGV